MWFFYSLSAGILVFGLLNLSDFLSMRYGKGYGRFLMATLPVALLLVPFAKWDTPVPLMLWMMLAGFSYGMTIMPFFTAYRYLDALSISVMGQMMPVCVLIAAWLTLGESITAPQATAFLLIICGSVIAAVERENGRGKFSLLGFLLLLTALVLSAVTYVITKHVKVSGGISAIEIFFLARAGMALNGIFWLCVPQVRKHMLTLPRGGSRQILLYLGNEGLMTSFSFLATLAVVAQPAGMNTSLVSVTYFGVCQVLMFAFFLMTGKDVNIKRKAAGAAIAFSGLIFLALSK